MPLNDGLKGMVVVLLSLAEKPAGGVACWVGSVGRVVEDTRDAAVATTLATLPYTTSLVELRGNFDQKVALGLGHHAAVVVDHKAVERGMAWEHAVRDTSPALLEAAALIGSRQAGGAESFHAQEYYFLTSFSSVVCLLIPGVQG